MTSEPASVDLSRPHFIAVGGIGMSGLAKISAARGGRVTGSDARDSGVLESLRGQGCTVHAGHHRDHLPVDASCVVVSTAVRPDNPELVAAREQRVPVVHRAQALAALMHGHRSVAVTGTHGKSSTSGMLATAFDTLGLDPSYAVGADLGEPGTNARHGSGDLFVAEADESDRSFHHYEPQVAVVLNIEEDHHDVYASLDDHLDAYEKLAARITPGGTLVISADQVGARELTARLRQSLPDLRVLTYGEAGDAEMRIGKVEPERLASTVTVRLAGSAATTETTEITFRVGVPGAHLAHNGVAALAAGLALGVDARDMANALGSYHGIQRRFTLKGEVSGVTVVDSYAHHPTEVAADLATARQVAGSGRVIAVFQPHLYSRTQALGGDLGVALAAADVVVVLDIYAAREDPVVGVSSDIVAHSALEHGALVRLAHDRGVVPEIVTRMAAPGDLVLTMGAGDVTTLAPVIVNRLAADSRPA